MQKSIELTGLDKVLALSRGTGLHISSNLIHLDELPDGTWRMTFTWSLLPAPEVLKRITFAADGKVAEASLQCAGFPALPMHISNLVATAPKVKKTKKGATSSQAAEPEAQERALLMLHLDQLDDKTWRMLYSKELLPDISLLTSLTLLREAESV